MDRRKIILNHPRSGENFVVFLTEFEIRKCKEESGFLEELREKYYKMFKQNLVTSTKLNKNSNLENQLTKPRLAASEISKFDSASHKFKSILLPEQIKNPLLVDNNLNSSNMDGEILRSYSNNYINKNISSEVLDTYNESEMSESIHESEPENTYTYSTATVENKSHAWSYQETKNLIQVMSNYIRDLKDPKKRKHVFEMVSNDLISMGYSVSATNVTNKWKSLMRSYSRSKDNKNKTGMGPSRFLFFEEMDEFLGDKPTNSCSHVKASNDFEITNTINRSGLITQVQKEQDNSNSEVCNDEEALNTPTRRGRISEIKLKKDYLEMKKNEYEERRMRHEERLEVENKKIKLLEDFLDYLKNH